MRELRSAKTHDGRGKRSRTCRQARSALAVPSCRLQLSYHRVLRLGSLWNHREAIPLLWIRVVELIEEIIQRIVLLFLSSQNAEDLASLGITLDLHFFNLTSVGCCEWDVQLARSAIGNDLGVFGIWLVKAKELYRLLTASRRAVQA